MRTTRLAGAMAVAAAAIMALAGCGNDGKRSRVTVSAKTAAQSAAAGTTGIAVAGGVTLDAVKLVVRAIELEREGAAGAAATGSTTASDDGTADRGRGDAPGTAASDAAGEVEVSAGPFLVDLSGAELASGTIVEQFTVAVPDGTYDELKFEIQHLEDGQQLGDPDFDTRQASVVVRGTLPGGAPFTFSSRLNDHQKLHGTFVIGGAGASNITLRIDPSSWFVGAGGALLDPTVEANRDAIEANIRASIDAFDDDDRDGRDDHEDHASGGADDGAGHT
jgi:hypothetical protein